MSGNTPANAYIAALKATPAGEIPTGYQRILTDCLDIKGKVFLCRAGIMNHFGVREENGSKRVIVLIDDTTVTVTEMNTGEVFRQHLIEPEKHHWPDVL